MIRERKMNDRSFFWKKASLLLALAVVGLLVAPAASMAIDPPQTVVYEFLDKGIGKSTGVNVLKPQCLDETILIKNQPDCLGGDFVVKAKVQGKDKREALATIITEKMKTCVVEPTSLCENYGDTDRVWVQVVYTEGQQEFIQKPIPIVGNKGDTYDDKIDRLREMANKVFNGNKNWSRAYAQHINPPSKTLLPGVYYLFARSLIQIDTQDPRKWNARDSFLAQDLFGLFLKDSVPIIPPLYPEDPPGVVIEAFRSTSRN